jgi:hypothetical protein
MQLQEPLAVFRREVGDAALLELVVPAFAPFGSDALRERVRDLRLVHSALDELHELRFGHACFAEQQRAQTRREVVIAEVAAAQCGARFVDRARQEHEARKPRTRIARWPPSQADRAHRFDGSRQL